VQDVILALGVGVLSERLLQHERRRELRACKPSAERPDQFREHVPIEPGRARDVGHRLPTRMVDPDRPGPAHRQRTLLGAGGISSEPADFTGTTTGGIGTALPDYKSVLSVAYNVGDWTIVRALVPHA
jgi:hypothetical protein